MKNILIFTGFLLITHFYVGYYTSLDIEDEQTVVFIKKYPTLQVRFENLYTTDADHKPLIELKMSEQRLVRDYCKYRLGIETWLDTQEELEACKKR